MNKFIMNKLSEILILAALLVLPSSLSAQNWEVGGGVGGNFFTSQTVQNAVTSGDAGLSNAIAASFWLGNNSSHLL